MRVRPGLMMGGSSYGGDHIDFSRGEFHGKVVGTSVEHHHYYGQGPAAGRDAPGEHDAGAGDRSGAPLDDPAAVAALYTLLRSQGDTQEARELARRAARTSG